MGEISYKGFVKRYHYFAERYIQHEQSINTPCIQKKCAIVVTAFCLINILLKKIVIFLDQKYLLTYTDVDFGEIKGREHLRSICGKLASLQVAVLLFLTSYFIFFLCSYEAFSVSVCICTKVGLKNIYIYTVVKNPHNIGCRVSLGLYKTRISTRLKLGTVTFSIKLSTKVQ